MVRRCQRRSIQESSLRPGVGLINRELIWVNFGPQAISLYVSSLEQEPDTDRQCSEFHHDEVGIGAESRHCGSADFVITKKAAPTAPPSNFSYR